VSGKSMAMALGLFLNSVPARAKAAGVPRVQVSKDQKGFVLEPSCVVPTSSSCSIVHLGPW
jgi:hypothetical protein